MSCAKMDPALHQAQKPPWIKVRLPSNPVFFSTKALISDFHAQDGCIQIVLEAAPDIYNHNMETVERLTPLVRSRAKYRTSLKVLRRARELSPKVVSKSGVMLGLGEKETELFRTMDDLREVGCEVLTMGQYLRPTPKHLPVIEYITPDQFNYYEI